MSPIPFHPLYMTRVWGGRLLESEYGRSLPDSEPYGESWEIVDREDEQSVVAAGPLGSTRTEEISVWVEGDVQDAYTIATKSLAPPPEKWEGLKDPELRYRRRYVDLYANPEVMQTFRERSHIVNASSAQSRVISAGFSTRRFRNRSVAAIEEPVATRRKFTMPSDMGADRSRPGLR